MAANLQAFSQPANFEAFISRAQGNRISFIFNKIDDIQNGITSTYTTQFGLNLVDFDGFGVGNEYTELYLRVSTDDDAIYSLDGGSSIPLNALTVTATNIVGFDGGLGEVNTFFGPINLSGSGNQDNILFSTRPAFETINFANHRVEITFDLGVANTISNEEPGFYIVNLDFWLYGCGTWGGVCPP